MMLASINWNWQMLLQLSHIKLHRFGSETRLSKQETYSTLITGCLGNPKDRTSPYKIGSSLLWQLEAWGTRNTSYRDTLQSTTTKSSVQVCWRLPCQINVSFQLRGAGEGEESQTNLVGPVAERVEWEGPVVSYKDARHAHWKSIGGKPKPWLNLKNNKISLT